MTEPLKIAYGVLMVNYGQRISSVALDDNIDELVKVALSIVNICPSCRSTELKKEQIDTKRKGGITKICLRGRDSECLGCEMIGRIFFLP